MVVLSETATGTDPPRQEPCPSTNDLLRRIRNGDEGALEALIEREWDGLLQFVGRMLGSPDDTEDVVQEVFVRVWEHRSRWTPGGSARAYLHRIARNLALLRLRHEEVRHRKEPELLGRRKRPPDPSEHAAGTELHDAFEEALDALPDRRKEAFLLVRVQGLRLSEAAEAMDVTQRTVSNHLYLAVCDLEEALRPFLD